MPDFEVRFVCSGDNGALHWRFTLAVLRGSSPDNLVPVDNRTGRAQSTNEQVGRGGRTKPRPCPRCSTPRPQTVWSVDRLAAELAPIAATGGTLVVHADTGATVLKDNKRRPVTR